MKIEGMSKAMESADTPKPAKKARGKAKAKVAKPDGRNSGALIFGNVPARQACQNSGTAHFGDVPVRQACQKFWHSSFWRHASVPSVPEWKIQHSSLSSIAVPRPL